MINVGFLALPSSNWLGGVNYYKNLLYAINTFHGNELNIIVFSGTKTPDDVINKLSPYATIIKDPIFDKKSLKWIIAKVLSKSLGSYYLYNKLFKKHNIDVLSHTFLPGDKLSCKTTFWIADFQHLHLPDMFSPTDVEGRNQRFKRIACHTDTIILSSHDALKDLRTFAPEVTHKAQVLQFVSQPSIQSDAASTAELEALKSKYSIPDKFFFLPNQFWKHKNHRQVFESIEALKSEGHPVKLVCSGSLNDFRNKAHTKELQTFIAQQDLKTDIFLLGIIDYSDVIALMRYSVAVINPSKFEGWSSTVEECKSLGKRMILSDLDVHREQAPPESLYFQTDDNHSLNKCLLEFWQDNKPQPDAELEADAKAVLPERTQAFAQRFTDIITETLTRE